MRTSVGHLMPAAAHGVKSIVVRVIPHNKQRYPTTGDWVYEEDTKELVIFVSDTGDWREAMAVAVHEIVEALICQQTGVKQYEVDSFDIQFEKRRDLGKVEGEPGDDPMAPYYDAHQQATNVEHILTTGLELHWDTYNRNLGELEE